MNPYNFSMLIFVGCSFLLSLLVLLKRQDSIGRGFFIFNIFVALWGTFHGIEISQNVNYDTALLLARLGQGFAVFVAPTWLHLTLIINDAEKKHKKWLITSYIVAALIVCFAPTPLFISHVAPTKEFLFYHRRGPVYDLFTVLFFIVIPVGFVQILQKIKRSAKQEAIPLIGFSIATGIGFIGGSFCFLPIYDILFPQYNLLILPIYPFLFSYFMIRHKLFDVEQIIEAFQKEKLATIGLLAASVNHEIRNPLYAAKSVLETYQENLSDGIPVKEPKVITDKVLNQINRALDVITKLNRFAKPAFDSASDHKASIPEALQNVLDLVSYEFSLEKIQIVNQIASDLPSIQADQRQLEEILFNLIVNACHAMKENGGELRIASESMSFSHAFSGNPDPSPSPSARKAGGRLKRSGMTGKVKIIIQDTGTGISPEQSKHLFEPFHTTKGDKGTGLGLYITKQLVERNGGKISVSSKPNQGTSFILEFKV